jgi:hypothetical protein
MDSGQQLIYFVVILGAVTSSYLLLVCILTLGAGDFDCATGQVACASQTESSFTCSSSVLWGLCISGLEVRAAIPMSPHRE